MTASAQGAPAPVVVVPFVRLGVDDLGRCVDAVGIEARGRVGNGDVDRVEAKGVARAGRRVGIEAVKEPLCGAFHRDAAAVDLDGSLVCRGCPDREAYAVGRRGRAERHAVHALRHGRHSLRADRPGRAMHSVALDHEACVRRSRGLRCRTAVQGARPSRGRCPRARRSSANRRPSSRRDACRWGSARRSRR